MAFPPVLLAKSEHLSICSISRHPSPALRVLTLLLSQESLAESFEAMTLYEEALIQYDELEASFFQNLKGPFPLFSLGSVETSGLIPRKLLE